MRHILQYGKMFDTYLDNLQAQIHNIYEKRQKVNLYITSTKNKFHSI